MTQLDQKKSEHLTPADCPDDAFILTKISKSGRQYFYMGETSEEGPGERPFIVAKTGYLPGDAVVFPTDNAAQAIAASLNILGIGGAPWLAIPLSDPLANSGTC
ncbi:conserved hypothetical protein [Roseibium sp. TrichSKD4]|uniref:hypothetical protein n=1 Tax=Roseibium sp. TrichSKD4 TaxID=744980 RepID=UPI0001E56D40|nr:hypothetical protein [Roseibium sp. TrichSKD4]EFO33257.1 conserved hypothetical protein [Roseibium sp. TrichSKD4]